MTKTLTFVVSIADIKKRIEKMHDYFQEIEDVEIDLNDLIFQNGIESLLEDIFEVCNKKQKEEFNVWCKLQVEAHGV